MIFTPLVSRAGAPPAKESKAGAAHPPYMPTNVLALLAAAPCAAHKRR